MTVMTEISNTSSAAGLALGLAGNASLRTPCGARRVENIRPGDLVVTRDAGLVPVRLVWTRTLTAAEIAADPSLCPVRLKPRAIGPMMPQRDLVLAGAHRVLVPGYRLAGDEERAPALMRARDIVAASDDVYLDKPSGDLTLYNVVFDAHHVFCADGLPVESFEVSRATIRSLDAGLRRELQAVFPDLMERQPEPAPVFRMATADDYRAEFI